MEEETSQFNKEMEKLERQQKGLRDNYNEERSEFNEHEYANKIRAGSMLKYGASKGEPLVKWLPRLQAHIDIQADKNISTHVKNNGRGCWFTHEDKFGVGCFMCEDLQVIHYLTSMITYLAKQHPEDKVDW